MCTEEQTEAKPWMGYLLLIISLAIVVVNGVVLYVLFTKKRMLKFTVKYLTGLLIGHFIAGLSGILLFFYQEVAHINYFCGNGEYFIIVKTSMDTALCASFICVILVTFDRMIAVKFPLFYINLNRKYFIPMILIGSLLPIIFFISAIVTNLSTIIYTMFLTTIFVTSFFLAFCNFIIYRIVLKHIANIKSVTTGSSDRKASLDRQQMKATRTCIIMVLSFIVLWMPTCLNGVLKLFLGEERYLLVTPSILRSLFHALSYLNSLVDPLLYSYYNSDIKRVLKKIFCRRTKELPEIILSPVRHRKSGSPVSMSGSPVSMRSMVGSISTDEGLHTKQATDNGVGSSNLLRVHPATFE